MKVELSEQARRDLKSLDPQTARRILRFLVERVSRHEDPRNVGEALKGSRFGELWRYRVGDYRLISRIEDEKSLILVLRIGHRREVYH